MRLDTKILKIFFWGIIISTFITSLTAIKAQTSFIRDDNFDFQGMHVLVAAPNTLNNFNLVIGSDSDFPFFKLRIRKNKLTLIDITGPYYATRYKVVIDGTVVQDWTADNEKIISYNFSNPPNGISATHTFSIQVDYVNEVGQPLSANPLSDNIPVTIFAKPRVYKDAGNNSFVQLRNEDASAKIPVLMAEGFDPLNENFPELYYNLTKELINTDLYPNGYEVFILNFIDGGRDLRLNAEVLLKAIEKVHEICPNYNIAVAGLSMGGPITRYALAKKENQNGKHNVGLFLSYDSPQDGAHINPDLQDWIKEQDPNQGAIRDLQNNLKSVAAKQMLVYNTYDPTHSFKNQFYSELNSFNGDGYPHQSYNVSVTNGNFNATWGYSSVGRHLMTMKILNNLIKDVPAVQLDCGTGSMTTNLTTRRYGDIFPNPLVSIYYELQIIFNPAYIPTWSGLHLINPDIDELSGNIRSFDRSKFDDYVVQTTPLQHHELSTVTRSKIMTWLNKDFNIAVNYSLPEGGSISPNNYQVNILHGIPITVQPKSVTVNGKQTSFKFYQWEDGISSNPRTFFTSHNVTHTASMKGSLFSNKTNTFANNSQRKFVRDRTGKLHLVYESMGKVWYERSTNNGVTWQVGNGGKPLSENDGKHPSIDNWDDHIIIAWQEKFDNEGDIIYKIKLVCFGSNDNKRFGPVDVDDQSWHVIQFDPYTSDAYPVIAWDGSGRIMVLWKDNTDGTFYYRCGAILNPYTNVVWYNSPPEPVINTTSNSHTPAIAATKTQGQTTSTFHLVWEQKTGTTLSSINYTTLQYSGGYVNQVPQTPTQISNSFFLKNYRPSIVVLSNGTARVSWIGDLSGIGAPLYTRTVLCNPANPTQYWSFDDGSISISVNSVDNSNNFYVAWSQYLSGSGWKNKFISSSNLSQIKILNTAGQDVQLSNGSAGTNMYVTAYYPFSVPYYFKTSNSLGSIAKSNINAINSSRSCIISKNDVNFIYSFGDIEVNNKKISFVEAKENLDYNNRDNLNSVLVTEPFELKKNSKFIFSEAVGITDSLKLMDALEDSSYIAYKVELVEDNTDKVIAVVKESRINSANLQPYNSTSYNLKTDEMKGEKVKIKITFETNITNSKLALLDHYSDDGTLGKSDVQQLAIETPDIIKDYALVQNYPNPFNPVTTINYQLPVDGYVTLKVYDILGKEVAALVKEYKSQGRYFVEFDASNLSSGTYIYELRVNDYSSYKKLMVLK